MTVQATGRGEVDLCGPWRFCADPNDQGVNAKWFAEEFDAACWRQVDVPIGFCHCGPEMDRYIGAGWFRRTFRVSESLKGRRVVLYFEGINYNASVWVNGKPVGENRDAYLPFELPVSDAVRYGQANLVVVQVDNFREMGQFPLFEGWFGQGGFLREARLVATDHLYLDHVGVAAEPAAGRGQFRLKATICNKDKKKATTAITVSIRKQAGKEVTTFTSNTKAEVAPGTEGELTVQGEVASVRPWSPEDPGKGMFDIRVARLSNQRVSTRGAKRATSTKAATRDNPCDRLGFVEAGRRHGDRSSHDDSRV